VARNNSTETLIPVDTVVAQSGLAAEWVWRRLDEREVEADWDGSYAVRWSVAKRIADDARAAREENDRVNAEMRERQEREIREQQEAANRRAAERQPQRGSSMAHGSPCRPRASRRTGQRTGANERPPRARVRRWRWSGGCVAEPRSKSWPTPSVVMQHPQNDTLRCVVEHRSVERRVADKLATIDKLIALHRKRRVAEIRGYW
jgi:hypothetical protein